MRVMLALALAAVVMACGDEDRAAGPAPPAVAERPTAPATPNGASREAACAAAADLVWEPLPGNTYDVSAEAEGPTCGAAVAKLTVRSAEATLLTLERPVADMPVMFDDGAMDPVGLAEALERWIRQDDATLKTTRALPPWAAGADAPELRGEFPFYPAEGLTQARYEELWLKDWPLFCVVQGSESSGCYALDPNAGELHDMGFQSFPG